MSEIAARYRRVAAGFGERVEGVGVGGWDRPAPCEGWTARDVVGHLVEWLPVMFAGTWGLDAPEGPSIADDPVGAWAALDVAVQGWLDDPELAGSERDTPMGRTTFEAAFDMIGTTDVFLHTWDLARATGQDERLDPDEVHRLLEGMEAMDDEPMRSSGHYGPRVAVPPDADEQTRLIAFIGRTP